MPVVQKFLLILVLMQHDGSFTYEKTLSDSGCPPRELIMINMNTRQKPVNLCRGMAHAFQYYLREDRQRDRNIRTDFGETWR